MKCNDILGQLIDVLVYYESLGIQICGLVRDDGGSNESFLHKTPEAFDLDSKINDKKSLSTIHLLDNSRRICFWSCGTYSQKAPRNNFLEVI